DLDALGAVCEIAPVAVVTVQDGGLGYAFVGGAVEDREELALGLEVLLKSAVEVEMLRREIGEDRDVDLSAAQLPQRQCVAGRLEHAPGPARDEKLGEELLHLDRFLRALTGVVLPLVIRDLDVHRRRVSRLGARRLEHVGDQMKARDRDEERGLFGLARVVGDLPHVDGRRAVGDGDLRRFQKGAELHRRRRSKSRNADWYCGPSREKILYKPSWETASYAPTNRWGTPPNPVLNWYGP